jgi:hypothetical protein
LATARFSRCKPDEGRAAGTFGRVKRRAAGPLQPTFLITRDGDVELFKTRTEVTYWVEAVDVEAGEYTGCFSIEGELLHLAVDDGRVDIKASGIFDPEGLSSQLRLLAERNGYRGDDPDPRLVADEVFADEWNRRSPRWPNWLDRRLHGSGPPRVDPRS